MRTASSIVPGGRPDAEAEQVKRERAADVVELNRIAAARAQIELHDAHRNRKQLRAAGGRVGVSSSMMRTPSIVSTALPTCVRLNSYVPDFGGQK
jgi:hypothetical protein